MVEVEVISKGTIKPSSPTPHHLRYYKLSLIDQIQPLVFMPFVMFFPKHDTFTNEQQHRRLKQSLSQVLTLYYPLAGRERDNLYIECNDDGIPYVETQIRGCRLSDFLQDPNPKVMNELLGYRELGNVGNLVAIVQVNSFMCGGMAIGIGLSHKIADGQGHFTFINSWAAAARGAEVDIVRPCFKLSTLFPPSQLLVRHRPNMWIAQKNISTRRFVFDAVTTASLKEKYKSGSAGLKCTRLETLSTFLWSRFIASTQTENGDMKDDKKLYTVVHPVNLRPRMDPPLMECHFGNFIRYAETTLSSNEAMNDGGYKMINKIRDTLKMVNKEHVQRLRDGNGHLNLMKELPMRVAMEEEVVCCFTNLSGFPLYKVDFGWGKPIWVGHASEPFKNVIVFLATRSGDGIEAWVNLNEEDMKKFEQDKELLAHVNKKANDILVAKL